MPTPVEIAEAAKVLVPNSVKVVDRILGASIEGVFYKVGGSGLLIFIEQQRQNIESQTRKLAHQLDSIPKDDLVAPPLEIKAPLVEQLINTEDESVSEVLIKLLRAAAHKKEAHLVHPALITVARNLAPDEITIIKAFDVSSAVPVIDVRMVDTRPERKNATTFAAKHYSTLKNIRGLAYPEKLEFYIEHLTVTLGLFEINEGFCPELQPDGSNKPHCAYDALKTEAKAEFPIENDNFQLQSDMFYMRSSHLGRLLIEVLKSHDIG